MPAGESPCDVFFFFLNLFKFPFNASIDVMGSGEWLSRTYRRHNFVLN